MSDLEPVRLPARDIPPPTTISDKARAALSEGALGPAPGWPPAHDLEAWRAAIGESTALWEQAAVGVLAATPSTVETRAIGGVTCHVATPPNASASAPLYFYIHGGAFVFGAGPFAKALAPIQADRLGFSTVSVDYRVPPDHPFPAAPEDCFAAYRALVQTQDPARIVVGGSSAGGNLAAALVLMIRDRGLPMPAGLVLLTPEVDLTEAGDSFQTNAELDVTLKGTLENCNALYAAGHDLTDPYLSPLYGDLHGFPPTLVQTGTRDILLSNSVLMHRKLRKAGVEAELHVWEAMPHAGFGAFGQGDSPENAEIDDEVRRFIARCSA
jgi:acetyl esterase/lipase